MVLFSFLLDPRLSLESIMKYEHVSLWEVKLQMKIATQCSQGGRWWAAVRAPSLHHAGFCLLLCSQEQPHLR